MSEKPDIVERLRRDQYKECDCWRCMVCEDAAVEIERLRAERDSWKHYANEYAERLQPLIMDVLYKHCEPLSHKWPGKRHVDCIGEAVEFLLFRLADAEKVVEAAEGAAKLIEYVECETARDNERVEDALRLMRSALTAYRERHTNPPARAGTGTIRGSAAERQTDMPRHSTESSRDTLRKQHSHRAPNAETQGILRDIRQRFLDLSIAVDDLIPPSRERSLAITKLDEARQWACNAATLGGEIREVLTVNIPA